MPSLLWFLCAPSRLFSLLIHNTTQEKDLSKGQNYGGMDYMPDIHFLVIVFALLALGTQKISEFSVDLTFILLFHQLREFQFQEQRS